MKKIIALLSLSFITAVAFGQENKETKTSYPYWTISKDIHRMQYKNAEFVPSTIVSGNSTVHISKGIHLARAKQSQPAVAVKMTGMPSSVISKGVARMQHERNKAK